MAEIRYCNLHSHPGHQRVQTVGTAIGPPGGDNWTQLQKLPGSVMPLGAREYALVVTGKIGDRLMSGTGFQRGQFQVVLGTVGGSMHPRFLATVPVEEVMIRTDGIPFMFLVLVTASIADLLLGNTWNPQTTELCLYARSYTNSDPQTYYCEFSVSDVQWLWFDLDSIPAGHHAEHRWEGANSLTSGVPPTNWSQLEPTFYGATGETWLHFDDIWTQSLNGNQPAPVFQFGSTESGTYNPAVPTDFTRKVGNLGRWGMNRMHSGTPGNTGPMYPNTQQGCLWVHTIVGTTHKAGMTVWEQTFAAGWQTTHRRWSHFAVRIDTLPDLRIRSEPGPQPYAYPAHLPAWQDNYLTVERPADGILTEPIILSHGVVGFVNQRASYGVRVLRDNGQRVFGSVMFAQADATRNEAVSSVQFGRSVFQTTSEAMQYRTTMVGGLEAPPVVANVWDSFFVHFHPVRDPNNLTDPPGTPPPPLILEPDKQSPNAGDLPLPPVAPNAGVTERGTLERNRVRGTTGYSRSWPLARALRVMTVTWGPLDKDDADAVFLFLQEEVAWRFVQPLGVDLAVMTASRPELLPDPAMRTFNITVDVGVLVWTGA